MKVSREDKDALNAVIRVDVDQDSTDVTYSTTAGQSVTITKMLWKNR